jgi:hypothetical protein
MSYQGHSHHPGRRILMYVPLRAGLALCPQTRPEMEANGDGDGLLGRLLELRRVLPVPQA